MFGIEDPGIYLAYLAAIGCVAFALWFGVTRWNREEKTDEKNPENQDL